VLGSAKRTVDGNGHALSQNVSIRALEGRHAAELVELAVVVRDALERLGVNDLKLELVGLGDGEQRCGARVVLSRC